MWVEELRYIKLNTYPEIQPNASYQTSLMPIEIQEQWEDGKTIGKCIRLAGKCKHEMALQKELRRR